MANTCLNPFFSTGIANANIMDELYMYHDDIQEQKTLWEKKISVLQWYEDNIRSDGRAADCIANYGKDITALDNSAMRREYVFPKLGFPGTVGEAARLAQAIRDAFLTEVLKYYGVLVCNVGNNTDITRRKIKGARK